MPNSKRLFNTSMLDIQHTNPENENYKRLQLAQKKGSYDKTYLNLINNGADNVMELSTKELELLHKQIGGLLALKVS